MALTAKIFLLFIGLVIVKSHHLHHFHEADHRHHPHHHHHHHHGIHDFIHNLFHPGIYEDLFESGLFGNGDSAPLQDGYLYPIQGMGQDENHTPVDIGSDYEDHEGMGYNQPGENYADYIMDIPHEPQIADEHDSDSHETEDPLEPDYEDHEGVGYTTDIPHEPQIADEHDSDSHETEAPIGSHYEDHEGVGYNHPDENSADYTSDIPHKPQIAGEHDSDSHETEAPTVIVDIKSNEEPKPDNEPKPDDESNRVDNNQPRLDIASDKATADINAGSGLNTAVRNDVLSGLAQLNSLEETNDDLINHKVPGFRDEDIKKGIVMVTPELKYNINKVDKPKVSTDAGLDTTVGNNAVQTLSLQNNPEEKEVDSNQDRNVITVPGFNDNDVEEGIIMVDPELKYNINAGHEPIVPDTNVANEKIKENGGNNVNIITSTDEPKLSHNIIDESQFSETLEPDHKKAVLGFGDEEIKEGILMIDPASKIIDTDKALDKYVVVDAIVFPDEVKQQNKVNVRQNLPTRVNRSDNTNQYPSVTAPVLTSTVQPSINNIQGQWIAPNSIAQTIPTSNNRGNLNQPSNLVFVQNPNQQVPVNNGNGYVNVVRNPNGEYTVVSIPNSNPGNYGVNKPSQIYIPGNSGVNNPGQVYVTDNSGVNSPGQIYVPSNVPSSGIPAGNGGLYNVIHLNNGQTVYVPVNNDQNNGNGQNAQWNGQPNNGQIYVPGNNNQGQGYQVLGNNPTGTVTLGSTGNQMNGGYNVPSNNVPLLISYKEKDGADKEESEISDSQRDRKEE